MIMRFPLFRYSDFISCVNVSLFGPIYANANVTDALEPFSQVAQYSDVIWASWGLKSTTVRLFVQPFGQADIKDNI